ncbi:MAG: HAAS signaling domain-containing protein, partial [Gammaproteobacteria bacterium]
MSNHELPRTIDAYLKQLKRALQGADKALIQDALYDAEEYLRNELHENPGKTETELLAGIATTYGIPEEVADA